MMKIKPLHKMVTEVQFSDETWLQPQWLKNNIYHTANDGETIWCIIQEYPQSWKFKEDSR